jgi:hypothetical protein
MLSNYIYQYINDLSHFTPNGSSTGVEHSPHYPKAQGLTPATSAGTMREKMVKCSQKHDYFLLNYLNKLINNLISTFRL